MSGERFGPRLCNYCGCELKPLVSTKTLLCDPCWELSTRISDYLQSKPMVLHKILDTERRELIKARDRQSHSSHPDED